MRTAMAILVALLVLGYVDEHYFLGQYTRATISIATQLVHFFDR
jgi:hypothetical protein